ncbi:MAG: hypothetical protein MUC85_13350 [Anaerolineales bacterium]|nr:hypothetical protein [Anaerolineales bacterium]
MAEITSNIASRRKGAMSVGFSLGIPLMAALSNAVSGGHAAATSQAHSTSDGQSHGWGADRGRPPQRPNPPGALGTRTLAEVFYQLAKPRNECWLE